MASSLNSDNVNSSNRSESRFRMAWYSISFRKSRRKPFIRSSRIFRLYVAQTVLIDSVEVSPFKNRKPGQSLVIHVSNAFIASATWSVVWPSSCATVIGRLARERFRERRDTSGILWSRCACQSVCTHAMKSFTSARILWLECRTESSKETVRGRVVAVSPTQMVELLALALVPLCPLVDLLFDKMC